MTPSSPDLPIEEAELAELFARLEHYDTLFLAVSGGVDSTALMHLSAQWCRLRRREYPRLHVLSVNHGLRPEADREVEAVLAAAAGLGLPAEALKWTGQPPRAAIQETARDIRYDLLLARVAQGVGRCALVTAHHRDDLAETLLMRLARGSGVDGLAAMQPLTVRGGIEIVRPLLAISRARLHATLVARSVYWLDDPSNDKLEFERARLRAARGARDQLGLDDQALALTARRMARARIALDAAATQQIAPCLTDPSLVHYGLFHWRWSLDDLPEEISVRLLMRLLPAIGGVSPRRVRLRRIERLLENMQFASFAGATLSNCVVTPAGDGSFHIYREPERSALPDIVTDLAHPLIWDNRFEIRQRLSGSASGNYRIRPLKRDDLLAAETLDSLPCSVVVLLSTPAIENEQGQIWLPALDVHGVGRSGLPLGCRFLVETLQFPGGEQRS